MNLSIDELHAVLYSLKLSGAACESLEELGLYGSVRIHDSSLATCEPIVEFLSREAPMLRQFDIRLPDYEDPHIVKFEVEHEQEYVGFP